MNKAYNRINDGKGWKDYPSIESPVNANNLNKVDVGLDEVDNRVITLDTTKATKVEVSTLIKEVAYDDQTGIITFTRKNGSSFTIDTPMEKIQTGIYYDPVTEMLTLPLIDGTTIGVDLSRLITEFEFLDSDTIAFSVSADGKVTAIVKEGSIEEKHLRPDYLADIKVEVAKAETSSAAAAESEKNAKASELASAASAEHSSNSAIEAAESAQAASSSAEDAKDSEDAAKISEDNAAGSAAASGESEEAAAGSAQAAADSAADAKVSENAAEASAGQAEDFSLMSKSYAVGTEGEVRPGDATDNSKFYSDLAQYLTDEAAKLLDQAQKLVSAATAGAIIPSGTVAFENLPAEPQVGYMYNISNSFVTDGRFAEGPGIQYNSGANVYWTKDGQWDVMIGVQVTGVKGAAESYYRQGNVDITPANIGLGNVPNVSTNDQTPTFTQAATRENINSGEANSTLWGKVRKWFADLKTVAFSGSYNDLSNRPSIPAAVRVKGNAESAYRTGDVNLTPANIGALPTTTGYAASDTPGGSANTLKGFKVTNGADIGYDITDNAIGYTTGAPEGSGQSDGCMYRQAFSTAWAHNIWGDYRSGRIYTRGKNNGTWQPWNKILCAADIENSLNSSSTENPLAAAQGKALKGMIEQTNVNLNGFASGNGVRDSSGAIQVNTSPIRAHIFRGGVSGTEKPWYKALEINVRHADNGDFEYVAYLLISYPFMAYYKEKMALVKLSIRRESGARLAILYATDSFDAADVCIKTYDSYSKLELWIKTTVMYDAISVDVISYSCVDPGNFRAHGYGKGIKTYTLTGYGQELPSGGTTEGPVVAFTAFPTTIHNSTSIIGALYAEGRIITAKWTEVIGAKLTITKNGMYYIKGHFGGVSGTFQDAQYQIRVKRPGESNTHGIAYDYGHHYEGMTSRQANTIEYLLAGTEVYMIIWTDFVGATFNTGLSIIPLMYFHS